jgi:hypothetical protein
MNTRRVVENFEVIVFPQVENEWTQSESHAVGAKSSPCMVLFQMPSLGSWKFVDCNGPARAKNTSRALPRARNSFAHGGNLNGRRHTFLSVEPSVILVSCVTAAKAV